MLDRRNFITLTSAMFAVTSVGAQTASAAGRSYQRDIMFFNLKNDLPQESIDRLLSRLKEQEKSPFVKGFFVGKNSLPKLDITPFTWMMISDFATQREKKAFLKNKEHADFLRDEFLPAVESTASFELDQDLDQDISDVEGIKVRQVGLFNFKDGISQIEQAKALQNLKDQAKTPGVKRLMVGKSILKKSPASPYTWMFMTEFASDEDVKAFRASREHQISEETFGPARSELAVVNVKI